MKFKIDSREGGSGPMFYVLLLVLLYAAISAVIAWQTLENCGGAEHTLEDWRVFPPGWECPSRF